MRNSENAKGLIKPCFSGVDIGSVTTNDNNQYAKVYLEFSLELMAYDRQKSGAAILESALDKVGNAKSTIEYIISAVYGHRLLAFSYEALPETVRHAKGTNFLRAMAQPSK